MRFIAISSAIVPEGRTFNDINLEHNCIRTGTGRVAKMSRVMSLTRIKSHIRRTNGTLY